MIFTYGKWVKKQWTSRIVSATVIVICSLMTVLGSASEEPTLCSDIFYLIEQSRSQFLAIQRDTNSDFGGYESTFILADAQYCVILEDVEKKSYKCTWKYPHGDERAHKAFQRFAKEMRNCIGNSAEERTDQPINHPDFYTAYYYQLAGGEARVTLKNKGKLMSTLVSIVIDGFTKPQ